MAPSSYITAKIAAAIGGFLGGAGVMTFIKPKTVGEAFMRGGVSVGSAIIFAGPLLRYFNATEDWELQLMAGACIGFISYSVLGMVANFLIRRQYKDIKEVFDEVRGRNKK